jgi:hypothetical protein
MAKAFDTKFVVTGPVFDGSGLQVMQGIINRGLLDIAILEGANKVKDQLYGPPASQYSTAPRSAKHGAHTRDLKRRVGAVLLRDNVAVFDAGKYSHGESIIYAERIEGLYHMFENATNAINRDKPQLYHKYIGGALVEAFQ